jgi:nucleoside-diphosphate-sugar epimerase
MRLLVLGGSWFLGRALVDEAIVRGHDVTVFNRGRTPPHPAAHAVHGDRDRPEDVARLARAGPWDACVDVHGVVPRAVHDSARALAPQVGQYAFVSTVSAYRDWPAQPVTEDSPLKPGDPEADPGSWTWGTGAYGLLKAGAELTLHREYRPSRLLILRPGIILGPHEYGGRLTWWLQRAARGGDILAPGRPDALLRPVDVRDVTGFLLDRLKRGTGGIYNVAGPMATWGSFLDACLEVTGNAGRPLWIDDAWLVEQGVRQWVELPMWRTAAGTWAVDTGRAESAGLPSRPLAQTVADTWAWMQSGGLPVTHDRGDLHGIDPDREAELLSQWRGSYRPGGNAS